LRVLITGAAGRIGRQLTNILLDEGHQVRAFGLAGDPGLAVLADRGVEVVEGDLASGAGMDGLAAGVDAVCHLAAALTTHDVADDLFVDVNLRGTFNLLEAVRQQAPELQRFVYTSSDAVYWTGGEVTAAYLPVDEHHTTLPGTVYGATKVGAEALCRSYLHSYGIPFAVMRPTATADPGELVDPGSVFGRRWFVGAALRWLAARDRLSPAQADMVRTLEALNAGDETLYSLVAPDGTSSLSMLGDARDVASGMRAMIEPATAIGEAFNIGPAVPHADRLLVEHLGQRLGLPVVEIRHESVRPSWYISSAKARSVLGYQPVRTVFDMVDEATESANSEQAGS